jgi:uncharacterized membrane protein YbaN (DUF454 family)
LNPVKKIFLITCGLIFTGLGLLGVFIPVLPTTPFMLLAAYCFMKSSDKLFSWVVNNKIFGKKVRKFLDNRSLSLTVKITCLATMWLMIIISILFLTESLTLRIILILLGITGSTVLILIKTNKE